MRILLTHFPLPMWVCDSDLRQILDVNEAVSRLLNCNREGFSLYHQTNQLVSGSLGWLVETTFVTIGREVDLPFD